MSNILLPKRFGEPLNLGDWPTDGLVLLWRAIEADNAVDESFYRNHGTITGATWMGEFLRFDGVGDWVIMPRKTLLEQSGTFILRLRINTYANGDRVMQEETAGYMAWQIVAGALDVLIYDTAFTTFAGLNTDALWHTYALTWDTTQTTIYKDGLLAQTDATFTGLNAAADNGYTIAASRTQGNPTAMDVSNHILYNRALSASEIRQLFVNPNLLMQQDLTTLWAGSIVAAPGGIPILRRRRECA